LGYNKEYENVDVNIWMLDKEVGMWGIELMMETAHIEWCFQFEKRIDLDNVKHVMLSTSRPIRMIQRRWWFSF
jgi:hypothetical protein